jgi:hypothetical protein
VAGGAEEEVAVLDERGAGGHGRHGEGHGVALLLGQLDPHARQVLLRLVVFLLTLEHRAQATKRAMCQLWTHMLRASCKRRCGCELMQAGGGGDTVMMWSDSVCMKGCSSLYTSKPCCGRDYEVSARAASTGRFVLWLRT